MKFVVILLLSFITVPILAQKSNFSIKLMNDSLFVLKSESIEFTGKYELLKNVIKLKEDSRIIVNDSFAVCFTNSSLQSSKDSIIIFTEVLLPNTSQSVYFPKMLYSVNNTQYEFRNLGSANDHNGHQITIEKDPNNTYKISIPEYLVNLEVSCKSDNLISITLNCSSSKIDENISDHLPKSIKINKKKYKITQ